MRTIPSSALGLWSVVGTGCFGPSLNCPDSLAVGEEAVLFATKVDDAVEWAVDETSVDFVVFVLPDGDIDTYATTSVTADPGFLTGSAEITIRGLSVGVVMIEANETTIGPGIGVPRPLGSAICTIEIH